MTTDILPENRGGEIGRVPLRSDRLFTKSSYWYFRTREGMDIGPFDSISEAADGVTGFVEFLQAAEPEVVSRIADYFTNVA